MTTVGGNVTLFKSSMGDETIVIGPEKKDMERLPTGIFALDLATGGGFPRRRVSIVFGPEGSGKSNVALKAVAMHQRLWPKQKCVWIDLEMAFDPLWASSLGVEVENLVLVRPSFAEQACEVMDKMLDADDIGLIVIDSLAALITEAEVEASADKKQMGGSSVFITTMMKKALQGLVEADKAGRSPTVIAINQVRQKVGVVYGDPETQPGGKFLGHVATLIVRLYGKSIVDPAISKAMPVRKETKFIIRKDRCPIYARDGAYEFVTLEHGGFKPGECDDWFTVQTALKKAGLLTKVKDGWELFGQTYATLKEAEAVLRADPVKASAVKGNLIRTLIAMQAEELAKAS